MSEEQPSTTNLYAQEEASVVAAAAAELVQLRVEKGLLETKTMDQQREIAILKQERNLLRYNLGKKEEDLKDIERRNKAQGFTIRCIRERLSHLKGEFEGLKKDFVVVKEEIEKEKRKQDDMHSNIIWLKNRNDKLWLWLQNWHIHGIDPFARRDIMDEDLLEDLSEWTTETEGVGSDRAVKRPRLDSDDGSECESITLFTPIRRPRSSI